MKSKLNNNKIMQPDYEKVIAIFSKNLEGQREFLKQLVDAGAKPRTLGQFCSIMEAMDELSCHLGEDIEEVGEDYDADNNENEDNNFMRENFYKLSSEDLERIKQSLYEIIRRDRGGING